MKRVARDLSVSARVSAWTDTGDYRNLWWRVAARGWSFGPEFFRFCRSGHAGSSGSFSFLNWWPDLHRSEGGGHDLRSLWRRVEARGLTPEPEIFWFCRSWADVSSSGTSFVKIFSDLCRFEWETCGTLGICGHAWLGIWAWNFQVWWIDGRKRLPWCRFHGFMVFGGSDSVWHWLISKIFYFQGRQLWKICGLDLLPNAVVF